MAESQQDEYITCRACGERIRPQNVRCIYCRAFVRPEMEEYYRQMIGAPPPPPADANQSSGTESSKGN